MNRPARWTSALLLIALTPLVGDAKSVIPSFWVCVTNERSGTMTVIDGDTWRVWTTIPLGKRPRGIHAAPDGRSLYVALSGSPIAAPPPAGKQEARGGRPLPPPDREADGVGVVEVGRRAMVRMIRVGTDPEEFAFSPDGSLLYVSNEDAGTASLVRVSDGVIEQTIPVGPEPAGVAISPDGRRVFVTCEASGEIAVLDAHARRLLTRWRVGGRPRSIAFLPGSSRAFVPSEMDARLHVLDLALGRVLGAIALPAGARPMGTVMTEGGSELWVSNGQAGTVSVVQPKRGTVLQTIRVGDRPWGMALSPDGRWLFVANGPSNDVSVVDRRTRREVRRIPAGQGPWGIATLPARGGVVAGLPPPSGAPEGSAAPAHDPGSAEAAVDVVRQYYAAIEARDYQRAYRCWGQEGAASRQTYEQFAAGFRNTAHVRAEFGAPGPIGAAAGSRYVEVQVSVTATTRSGEHQRFVGRYVLRRAVVDGATPAQRSWHIDSATMRAASV